MVKAVKAGKLYALKTLLAKPEMDLHTQVQMFYHEGAILQEINHPRIPKCLDVFQLQENHFMVQEYIQGTPLSSMIEKGYSFAEYEIKQIMLQLLEILSALHTQGIVHRDLRLSNLLWHEHKLYLIDFGFARKFTRQHQKQRVILPDPPNTCSSSSYLAQRRASSPLSDFFGVGLVAMDLSSNWSDSGLDAQKNPKSPFFQSFIKLLLKEPDSIPSAKDAIERLRSMM